MLKYSPPTYKSNGFNCSYCHAYAEQTWLALAGVDIDDMAYGDMTSEDVKEMYLVQGPRGTRE